MSEVESLLRRVQAAEDKLEGIQDRIDRLEKHMKELRLKLENKKWYLQHLENTYGSCITVI